MIFGIGGVGSFIVEALARAAVGHLILVDYDDICLTNINRQLHALRSTVGEAKVEVMKRRILEINPEARVETIKEFYTDVDADRLLGRKIFHFLRSPRKPIAEITVSVLAEMRTVRKNAKSPGAFPLSRLLWDSF